MMQELKQLVAGRVELHHNATQGPWWGHQNFMVRLHPQGCWKLAKHFFKKERDALLKGRKRWGPVLREESAGGRALVSTKLKPSHARLADRSAKNPAHLQYYFFFYYYYYYYYYCNQKSSHNCKYNYSYNYNIATATTTTTLRCLQPPFGPAVSSLCNKNSLLLWDSYI